jgi:hypothetical protein
VEYWKNGMMEEWNIGILKMIKIKEAWGMEKCLK